MALATNAAAGTIILTSDLHGSTDPYGPELTATGVVPGEYLLPSVVVDVKGRILYLEEGIDVPCATDSSCGLVRPGNNIKFVGTSIGLHQASDVVKGVVMVDGVTVISDGCCIKTPIATTTTIGSVIVPTSGNIDVDVNGNISLPLATDTTIGVISVDGSTITINGGGEITTSLPIADVGVLGMVKIGSGFNIQGDGTLDVDWDVSTSSTIGLIKIPGGSGSPFVSDGLSVDGSGNLTISNIATVSKLGGVIVPVSGYIDIDGSGNISVPLATNTTPGIVKSGDTNNITITSGDIDVGPNVAKIDTSQTYSTSQRPYNQTTSPAAEHTPDFGTYNSYIINLNDSITMYNPDNIVAGGFYSFILKQDATGSRTVSWDTKYKFMETPVLSTGSNAVDVVTMFVKDTNTIYCQLQKNFS